MNIIQYMAAPFSTLKWKHPCAVLLLCFAAGDRAHAQQSTPDAPITAAADQSNISFSSQASFKLEHPGGRDIEDLNLRGGYIHLPPFKETIFGATNPVRQALASHGVGLTRFGDTTFTYNTTAPPVPLAEQTYLGQRPTWKTSHYFLLTWDLRQLGVHGGQLYTIGTVQKISWNPGGPNAVQFGALAYYQSLFNSRLELKGGYINNDTEFVGTAIAGQASSGSLGVFASLPFEVGMSYLPLTAPGFNTNYHITKKLYAKVGFQRSIDPQGGVTNAARDAVGLRFAPKGTGLLSIYEGGYKQEANESRKQMWIRAGYMYNSTHYKNLKTGGVSTNNYLAYALIDRQIWRPSSSNASRGVYAGASAMAAPAQQNAYSQYYELRVYMLGPFSSRSNDMLSVVSSHTAYSPYAKRTLAAQTNGYWNSATSLTGSYNLRLYRGLYVSPGVSYTNGPAITPKTKSSLNLLAQVNLFF
jgi:porin